MYLGIEIGGTKLQLGVGNGTCTTLTTLERFDVDPRRGARGILEQIKITGRRLIDKYDLTAAGFGFGGPIETRSGTVITSHQIAGWDGLPLADWCREQLGIPAVLGNDCDVAALAEAHLGAGKGKPTVFYVTIGTGIGGGLVLDGEIHRGSKGIAAEIGHLRPELTENPTATVESIASGPGIVAFAQARCRAAVNEPATHELSELCDGDLDRLTAVQVADAAAAGNPIALASLETATRTLGWAVAQVITLIAPEVIIIGGGVSLMDRRLFLEPVRRHVQEYVFPPLRGACELKSAQLGEEVVVHGALTLVAREQGMAAR